MFNALIRLSATFFYLGFFPFASGTLTSAAGVGLFLIFRYDMAVYLGVLGFITALGFIVAGPMERIAKEKDPSCIVIDEVAGVLIAFWALPATFPVMITAFFLFRAFDMFKIYPANILESREGSAGVMMDDVVAGIYTNLTMHAAIKLLAVWQA